jgi:3-hydroxyisobutyrate dehydrogenase
MSALPSIALLGTGRMGAPIARNLLAGGYRVTVWNRTRARAAALAGDGAHVADSPAAAATGADVVISMLTDGPASEAVMSGPDGALHALARGSVWIQMGTIGLDWTARLARAAADSGVALVDAPVSGSDGPAAEAQLVVLASGPDEARERVLGIFDVIGRRTLWLGPAGNGSKAKLALNAWLAAQVEAMAETIGLAQALGIDPRQIVDTIADGPLGSPYAVQKATAMLDGRFAPGFALRHAYKDVALALAAATEEHLDLPVADAVARRWSAAIDAGHADEDVASVYVAARARTDEPHSRRGVD